MSWLAKTSAGDADSTAKPAQSIKPKDDREYLKTLSNYFKCPSGKIQCEGCMALTSECWGNECKIVQCARHCHNWIIPVET